MTTSNTFEITDLHYEINLSEPVSKELVSSAYELLRYIHNSLDSNNGFTTSFTQLVTVLDITPDRLINSIYILKLRKYCDMVTNDLNVLIVVTLSGNERFKLINFNEKLHSPISSSHTFNL